MEKPEKSKNITETIKIEYFPFMGRADPLIQMFEWHGQPYEKIIVDQSTWNDVKGTQDSGEFD